MSGLLDSNQRPRAPQVEKAYRKVLVFSRLIKFMSICKVIVY